MKIDSGPLSEACGEQEAASIAAPKDPGGLLPAGFIARPQPRRRQGAGSDALPIGGDERIMREVCGVVRRGG
ncbi:hypothetical protein GCM10017620_30430 [Brevundimonas intermedia]|uniref:Uncharacterized protein n=1 Tax=Brevundimonas intermedia TaxID=74315 RepID=A0ABQ5TDI7_9CAUL|nr:hypothetical protein GCM10017620_30430 [Brevundimonas intermedia]